jgi:hypothetical protein
MQSLGRSPVLIALMVLAIGLGTGASMTMITVLHVMSGVTAAPCAHDQYCAFACKFLRRKGIDRDFSHLKAIRSCHYAGRNWRVGAPRAKRAGRKISWYASVRNSEL